MEFLPGAGEDERSSGVLQDKSRQHTHKASSPAQLTYMKPRTDKTTCDGRSQHRKQQQLPGRGQDIYWVKEIIRLPGKDIWLKCVQLKWQDLRFKSINHALVKPCQFIVTTHHTLNPTCIQEQTWRIWYQNCWWGTSFMILWGEAGTEEQTYHHYSEETA